jgi:hypothetical protein
MDTLHRVVLNKRFIAVLFALILLVACQQNNPNQPSDPNSPNSPATPETPAVPTEPVDSGGVDQGWSNPDTWGGTVPDANSSVTIPEGNTVYLDGPISVRNITVMGTLLCADRDVELKTNWLMIHAPGNFQCGTEDKPHTKRLEIILNAKNENENVMGMGTKFLGAMGGTLELHGESKTSWTKLDGTAQAGVTTIKVLEATNWRVGDRIAIAPTDFEPMEAEERTITAVNGTTLTLDKPLLYRHWGKIQTLGTTGATLDQRAEVGLLSRNITIRGENAQGSYFGGHVMFMDGAVAKVSSVEFVGLGQLTKLGRYPVHFHKLGDEGSKSYLKNSSIHHTLQRGVVVHQTNNLMIENNALFDVVGHAMFLESAIEVNNTFDRNLIMLVRMVPKAYRSDKLEFELCNCFYGAQLQAMHDRLTPAGFWISNQHNRFTNNTVAGVQFGYGYWYNETEMSVADQAEFYNNGNIFQGLKPEAHRKPFLEFSDNTAHSISAKNDADYTTQYTRPMGAGLFFEQLSFFPDQPGTDPVFKNFRVWKVSHTGVWAQTFTDSEARPEDKAAIVDGLIAADNRSALFVEQGAGPTRVRNSVLYGQTDNLTPGLPEIVWRESWKDYWLSLNHSLENVAFQSVATSPNTLPSYNDITAETMLSLRANDGLNTPVFLEWNNVITKGWPE